MKAIRLFTVLFALVVERGLLVAPRTARSEKPRHVPKLDGFDFISDACMERETHRL